MAIKKEKEMTALYEKNSLAKKTPLELRRLAKKHGLDTDGLEKGDLIKELVALEEEEEELDDELDDEDELDDLDDELDDEDEVDEPAPKAKKGAAKAPAKKAKTAAGEEGETLAAKQVATILGTEPKTLRQFFRSDSSTVEPVGSGGRYEFAKSDIDKIKKEFDAWRAAHAARGSKRGPGKKGSTPANVEELEEVEEIEELEDDELDDELDDDDIELDDDEEDA